MNAATATPPSLSSQDEERFHVQREARASAGRTERTRASLRLLVVDDEVAVCKALKRNLGRWYEVVALEQAREALELILGGQRFDAILCDVVMPEMSGPQFFEALTRLAPEQARRITFMTGGAFTTEAQAFLDSACTRCVDKPLDLQSLRATLEGEAASYSGVEQP
jgi:CheY-like chemotaxis protein